jgi:hypothetical protein
VAAERRDSKHLNETDTEFYTVLGAILDHEDKFREFVIEGISNEDIINKVRDWLHIEFEPEQAENFRRIIGKLRSFRDSEVYFKPRC